MVVTVYPLGRGRFSFKPTPMPSESTCIQAPKGSVILDTKLFGPQLFVPGSDRRVRYAMSASQVMQSALAGDRFKVLEAAHA